MLFYRIQLHKFPLNYTMPKIPSLHCQRFLAPGFCFSFTVSVQCTDKGHGCWFADFIKIRTVIAQP